MTTNTRATLSTVDGLMVAYRAHVSGTGLPEPCMVQLNTNSQSVDVQTSARGSRVDNLCDLVIWAQTLDAVTGTWWRTPSNSLHVTILGRSSMGVPFKLYSSIGYSDVDGLVRLEVNESESVSVDELHLLVGLLREEAA